LENFNYKR